MNQLILNVESLYSEAYKNVTFRHDLAPHLERFLFDHEQIKRVLINLMENALAALDGVDDPTISFTTQADSLRQTFSITISDNGRGIPDGNYAKLFEPYYSTKVGGSGLGLAIVSKIIEDHGGIIQAYGNETKGLSFKIDLPYKTTHKDANV